MGQTIFSKFVLICLQLFLFVYVNDGLSQSFDKDIASVHQLVNNNKEEAALAFAKIRKENLSPDELAQYNWYKAYFCTQKDSVLHYASVPRDASITHKAMLWSFRGKWHLTGQWKPNKAKEECQKAYKALKENPSLFNDFQQLYITINNAVSQFALGNYNLASFLANEQVERLINAPCGNWTNAFLNSVVLCNVTSNRPDIAQLCGDKAIKCFETFPNLVNTGSASLFNNLGQMHIVNSNYYKALQYQLKAKKILDKFNKGIYNYEWYWHMGWLHTEVGNFSLAASYIKKAKELIIAQEGVDSYDHFLINLVEVNNLLNSKQLDSAGILLETIESQAVKLNVQGDNYIDFIEAKGTYYELKGAYEKAISIYKKVLDARLQHSGENNFFVLKAYRNLIKAQYQTGHYDTAKALIFQSKKILKKYFEKTQFPEILDILLFEADLSELHKTGAALYRNIIKHGAGNNQWLLAGYFGLAKVYFNTYKKTGDELALFKAVNAIEKAYLYNNQALYFLNNIQDRLHYESSSETLLQIGTEIAYAYHQKKPSVASENLLYTFIDYSKHNFIKQKNKINQFEKISGVSSTVFNEEKRLQSEIVSLQKLLNVQTDTALQKQYLTELNSLKETHHTLLKEISNTSALYYNYFITSKHPSIAQTRKSLEKNKAFVSYKVAGEKVYMLYIDDSNFIIKTANQKKVFSYLEQLKTSSKQNDPPSYTKAGYALFKILFEPLLKNNEQKTLLISLDPKIYPLNMETLVVSDKKCMSFSELEYVLYHYKIQYILSASTYSMLQDYQEKSNVNKGASIFIPEFSASEKIVKQPFMLATARKITDATNAELYVAENATKANFKHILNQRLQMCMIGSHAVIDNENPLQSKILLSTDTGGVSPLYASELLEQKTQVSMPVITSCSSASGKYYDGTGLISFANVFLYSGAKSVVCSFWDIDEKTSATILENAFLKYSSHTFNNALRNAKIDFLKTPDIHPKLCNPYYWGGIVMIGEDNSIAELDGYNRRNYTLILLGTIVFLTVGYFVWKSKIITKKPQK